MGATVLVPILSLFSAFHQDAMLSADILALIKVLGNVEDTSAFRAVVLPEVSQVIANLEQHACVTQNMQEVSRMVDSGIVKAMLDIFVDYFLSPTQKRQVQLGCEDESAVLQVGNLLLRIVASRACLSDFHLRLYSFRALAVVCKVHPGFRSQKTAELI